MLHKTNATGGQYTVMTKATGTIKMPAVKNLTETKPLMVYVPFQEDGKIKGQISIGLRIYVVISMIILLSQINHFQNTRAIGII